MKMEQKINNPFFEKLKSLGVQVGTGKVANQKAVGYSIREVIKGYDIETPLGITFAVENIYPRGSLHGNINLFDINNLEIIHKWAKIPQYSENGFKQYLFLDTETSSLAGGAGTFIFMVGLGFYFDNYFKVIQLFLEDPESELPFLSALEKITAGFNTLVTFNGKSFDIPMIRNRYSFSQYPHPFDGYFHIDLLHLSRRIWKKRLASCRLSELEQEILGFNRSEEEIPGWLVPEIYHDYLFSRDSRPLAGVFYHNQNDIVSMAALASIISKMLSNPYDIEDQDDIMAIGNLMDDLSIVTSAQQIYEYCEKLDLPVQKEIELLLRSARLYQRQSLPERAVLYLEASARLGSLAACIQASKYYEHNKKQYDKALYYAQMSLDLKINSRDIKTNAPPRMEIERRINRVKDKMNRIRKENGNGQL